MREPLWVYVWWLVVNEVMCYLELDFLCSAVKIRERRYFFMWLTTGGILTAAAVRYQLSGMFIFMILLFIVFARVFLKIHWKDMTAPVAVLFTAYTIVEGESAVLLSLISTNLKLDYYGTIVQILASALSALIFFLILQLIRRRYSAAWNRLVSSYLYILLLPCICFILIVRCSLRLDSSAFEKYLASFGIEMSFAVLFCMFLSASIFFLILEIFCKMIALTEKEKEAALLSEQMAVQKNYIEEARKRNDRYASFLHDVDNHLLILSGLLKEERFKEAEAYAENLHTDKESLDIFVSTGNAVLDILLKEKLGYAEQCGIETACSVQIPEDFCVDDMDLCVIFSNIMDNAVCACRKSGKTGQTLNIWTKIRTRFLLIEGENTVDSPPDGEIKEGTGLGNIRNTAEKYQGLVETELENGIFRISVLLCLDQKAVRE